MFTNDREVVVAEVAAISGPKRHPDTWITYREVTLKSDKGVGKFADFQRFGYVLVGPDDIGRTFTFVLDRVGDLGAIYDLLDGHGSRHEVRVVGYEADHWKYAREDGSGRCTYEWTSGDRCRNHKKIGHEIYCSVHARQADRQAST